MESNKKKQFIIPCDDKSALIQAIESVNFQSDSKIKLISFTISEVSIAVIEISIDESNFSDMFRLGVKYSQLVKHLKLKFREDL